MRQNNSHANAHAFIHHSGPNKQNTADVQLRDEVFRLLHQQCSVKKYGPSRLFQWCVLNLFICSVVRSFHTHARTPARTHALPRTHTTQTHTHLAKGLGYYLMGLSLTVPHG